MNPFKWIKTNMNMDNYGLDFVIWIFCPGAIFLQSYINIKITV